MWDIPCVGCVRRALAVPPRLKRLQPSRLFYKLQKVSFSLSPAFHLASFRVSWRLANGVGSWSLW